MIRLTLSQRLSVVFCALLLACCGALLWIQMRSTAMHEQETVQRLSRGLAEHIARSGELMDARGMRGGEVRALFGKLMAVNPSVEVYLLDDEGRILGHDAPDGHLKRDRVDLAPVQALLHDEPLPILGDDPRSATGRKVFNAAPLWVQGRQAGYIYVVLVGEQREALAANIAANATLRTTLWSLAIVAVVGLLAGVVAFRWVTRPLRQLTRRIQAFDVDAAGAGTPLPPTPLRAGERDELAILQHSFGHMGQRLGEQWQQLREQDLQRRELVANISHDLRTPLSSLHGYLETLALPRWVPTNASAISASRWRRAARWARWHRRCSNWRGWSTAESAWTCRRSRCPTWSRTCSRNSNWPRRRAGRRSPPTFRPGCPRSWPIWG